LGLKEFILTVLKEEISGMNQLVDRLRKLVYFALIFIFNRFPIKRNKIFLFSYYGTQYGGNPKYITEYILEHVPKGTFDIVWAFVDPESKPHLTGFRKVKRFSLQYFYELCSSKIVITNYRTTEYFKKRKKQYYIQTWHSSLRLKQIEKDAEGNLPLHYVQMAIRDSLKCDLLLSGCKAGTEIFRRSFWYEGEIFEHGTPRNDVLFQKSIAKRLIIKENLHVPKDYKVITYAPTFRKDNSIESYKLDFNTILSTLEKEFGDKWIFLVRLHPHLINHSNEIIQSDNVIDVTTYDDIQEILYISDILITDYSSLMFDFGFTTRPCFLYVPDLKDYTDKERKLYFDIDDLPFIKALSANDLLHKIQQFNREHYIQNLKFFNEKVGSFEEGEACKQLVSHIQRICYNHKITSLGSSQQQVASDIEKTIKAI
jgi:CDP-glycerol glycerophosphotransferase